MPVVGFAKKQYNVSEEEEVVTICIQSNTTESFEVNLTVSLRVTDGTASESYTCKVITNDYFLFYTVVDDDTDLSSPSELNLVFPAGTDIQQRCINISIVDDTLLEGDQAFTMTITDAGSYARTSPSFSVTSVVIADDESKYTIIDFWLWMVTLCF